MSDDRTPEQVAADDALTAAIEQARVAYYGEPEASVLTEYLVIASRRSFDDDGGTATEIALMPRDGDVPLHQLLGMIRFAAVRFEKLAWEDD